MIIKSHLCGTAIAFSERGKGLKNGNEGEQVQRRFPVPAVSLDDNQGSLVNFQKRKIQDAIFWMATFSRFQKSRKTGKGPLVFVCTTSPEWGPEIYTPKISTFVHNLRNGYGCENYLWVREFTEKGFPHYHFVADVRDIKSPVGLSRFWSGLFGAHANNSVRLGSKPNKDGKRTFRITPGKAGRMASYLSRYLSKQVANDKEYKAAYDLYSKMTGVPQAKLPGRRFAISQEVARNSLPETFRVNFNFSESAGMVMSATGQMVPAPVICTGTYAENHLGETFDKNLYTWKKSKEWPVWFGNLKK